MGKPYETMRSYLWERGWTPFRMCENGKVVLGWELKSAGTAGTAGTICQDIEMAYGSAHFMETIGTAGTIVTTDKEVNNG